MKILILGGDGMLGHRLLQSLRPRHDVRVTLRGELGAYADYRLFDGTNAFDRIDARDTAALHAVLQRWHPDAVVNCVGIIKQRSEAHSAIPSLEINSLLPHRLAQECRQIGARLVHLSTDCVFSGERGNYTEEDREDCYDLYGRSKLLGEVSEPGCITLRTSIIGTELSRKASLIEWYLAQRGGIRGFKRAIYSGFTTHEMSRIIERVLLQHPDLSGLWHVASEPISKYDLLCELTRLLSRADISIAADTAFVCDRSLNGKRFTAATGYHAPSWSDMLAELATAIRQREGEL
jgi:dTDP-4-dehydrorhamnose reductase